MSQENRARVWPVLASVGKAAAYLLLFLGSQSLLSTAFVMSISILTALDGRLITQEEAVFYLTERANLITLWSGLLTLAVLLIFNLIRRKPLGEALTLRPVPVRQAASAAALAPPLYLAVVVVLSLLPERWLYDYAQASSSLEDVSLLAFLATVVVAPVVEEMVFRGLVQSRLRQAMPDWLALLLSAGVFGLCHGQLLWMAYAFVLGLAFGVVALRCNSILPTILMHMVFNALGHFSAVFGGETESAYYMIAVLVLSLVCLVSARRGIADLLRPPLPAGPDSE
jgi:membrane protease YdiL (CAAX protease family)